MSRGGENVNGDNNSYVTMTEPDGLARHATRLPDGTFCAVREPGEPLSREEVAGMLSDVLRILHARVTTSRFKPKTSDPGLMAMVRGFVGASQALTAVLRDRDLDDLDRRIAALEEAVYSRRRDSGTMHEGQQPRHSATMRDGPVFSDREPGRIRAISGPVPPPAGEGGAKRRTPDPRRTEP